MAKDFLKDWMGKGKKSPNPNDLSPFTIDSDRYDRQDHQRLLEEMKEYRAMRDKLADSKAGDLAYPVTQDLYLSLWKVDPDLLDENKVRPQNLVNRKVMQEAVDLPDYRELRMWTQGDDIGAALAFNTIEPDIETLYDKLEGEQKLAQELQELMAQMAQAQQEQRDLEEMFKDWTENNPEDSEPQDYQEKAKQLQERMEALQQQMQEKGQELKDALNGAGPEIRGAMKQAMKQANEDMEAQENMAQAWGLEPGQLHRLPANERMELARKLNSPKFKKIAELFGPMKRLAFTENRRKVNYTPEEVYDVEQGNNLRRVLPSELGQLMHPLRRMKFFKQYMDRNLLQYKMRGYEKVAKGGIVFCHDGSGSMSGEPEIWTKALGLCLLHIARKQKREFYAIQFGSPHQIRIDDFRDSQNIDADKVLDFAEFFFGGGTDFRTPLTHALTILQEQHERFGAVKADIVFATDGMCSVDDQWLTEFKKEQDRLGFQVWGVNIGGSARDEPMWTICDQQVATIKSLTSGESVREIFNSL